MDTCFVTAKLTAKKGMEAQLEAEVVKNIPNVRAEKGCIRYDFHKNRSEDGTFLFYEIWESPEALDAHGKTPHLSLIHIYGERRWYRAERIGNTDKLYLALIEGQPLYDFTVSRRLDTDTRNKTRVRHTDDPDPVRHTDVTLLAPLTAGDVPCLVESDDPDAPLMLVGCRIRKRCV